MRTKKEFGLIYKLTNPKGKVYIGQTVDLATRMCDYKGLRCKGQIKLYRSIVKYGFSNHKLEIIKDSIKVEKLDQIETDYISLYNSVKKGLNCCYFGGAPNRGRTASTKTRLKMSKSRLGKTKVFTKEHNQRVSCTLREGFRTGRIKHPMLGKKCSEEAKEKMRIKLIGRPNYWKGLKRGPMSLEARQRMSQNSWQRGKPSPGRKLSEKQVAEIKGLLIQDDRTLLQIGEMYNVSKNTIGNIKYGLQWNNIKPSFSKAVLEKDLLSMR